MDKEFPMQTKLLMCLLILFSCSMNACTSMRPVTTKNASSHDTAQATVDKLRVGDSVSLTTIDGAAHNLTVVEINDRVLRGVSCEDCSAIAIPITGIDSLYVERTNVVKSAGAGAGVILTIVIVLALIAGPGFSPGL